MPPPGDREIPPSGENAAFPQNQLSADHSSFLSLLLSCEIFAAGPAITPAAPRPRIHTRSRHYRFAVYLLAGCPYDDACRLLEISPRTAERWRTDLRRTASRYFGRAVTYEFAARYALDATLRHACECVLRASPQSAVQNPCFEPQTRRQ